MIVAIVLAAGTSSRYGANKLLLPFGSIPTGDEPTESSTVISSVVNQLSGSRVHHIVVVTGHQREMVEAALRQCAEHTSLTFAHNADYRAGEMLSSIKTGLAAAQHLCEPDGAAQYAPRNSPRNSPRYSPHAVMIVLGDQPLIRRDVVDHMAAAFEQGCGELIAPRFGANGPRGHPVLIGSRWWQQVLALPPGSNVRELLRANRSELTHLVVNTDSILGDVDTPEAYQAAVARLRESDGRRMTND